MEIDKRILAAFEPDCDSNSEIGRSITAPLRKCVDLWRKVGGKMARGKDTILSAVKALLGSYGIDVITERQRKREGSTRYCRLSKVELGVSQISSLVARSLVKVDTSTWVSFRAFALAIDEDVVEEEDAMRELLVKDVGRAHEELIDVDVLKKMQVTSTAELA